MGVGRTQAAIATDWPRQQEESKVNSNIEEEVTKKNIRVDLRIRTSKAMLINALPSNTQCRIQWKIGPDMS
jgi:hypothetical protein